MADSIRAFFALQPDDDALDFLTNRIQLFRAHGWERFGRFLPLDTLHLTLRFFPGASPETLERLEAGAATICRASGPVDYEIGPCQLFPRVARARIVAATVKPSAGLKELARRLEELSVECGFAPEKRIFKPHITLARLKNGMKRPNLPSRPGAIPQRAAALFLMRSDLHPEGAVHTELARFALGDDEEEDEDF